MNDNHAHIRFNETLNEHWNGVDNDCPKEKPIVNDGRRGFTTSGIRRSGRKNAYVILIEPNRLLNYDVTVISSFHDLDYIHSMFRESYQSILSNENRARIDLNDEALCIFM